MHARIATPPPQPDRAALQALGVPRERVPRHVAVIMDGNGRWAQQRSLPRVAGHGRGAERVREIAEACADFGVEALTLYSFSSENWKRPADEVGHLMELYVAYMRRERDELVRRNIRFKQIGRREGLPADALEALDEMVEATSGCTGPTLCLAVNYGSRAEIADAVRSIARDVRSGVIGPEDVDEAMISGRLQTADLPDPDLLIRTAGEMRISNYLLWQISYSELYVTPTLWPDFDRDGFAQALRAFAGRARRFGGLGPDPAG